MRWRQFRCRWGPTRWRTLALALAIALVGGAATGPPAFAAYQGSVYSNWTAFNPCLGINDPYPERMRKNAVSALTTLTFATTSYTKATFTRTKVLSRVSTDYAFYVHSHGDFYGGIPGFRVDGGACAGGVVDSADIATKRDPKRQTNFVVMSTCHLGESVAKNNMPLVFGIEKDRAGSNEWNGPEFYLGYVGSVWDSDMWEFEAIFWDRLLDGHRAGAAFDLALADGTYKAGFGANWWGSYLYDGTPGSGYTGPIGSCGARAGYVCT